MTKKIFTEDDIISFVDGTFDKTKTNEIKKFINKNNEAKKIYLFYWCYERKEGRNYRGFIPIIIKSSIINPVKNPTYTWV